MDTNTIMVYCLAVLLELLIISIIFSLVLTAALLFDLDFDDMTDLAKIKQKVLKLMKR